MSSKTWISHDDRNRNWNGNHSYSERLTLAAAGTSEERLIPPDVECPNFIVVATGSASAMLQYTLDSVALVDADAATWYDNDYGSAVSGTPIKGAFDSHPTAVRLVQTNSGTSTLTIHGRGGK